MADSVNYANPDRDIEQALIVLKTGAQLTKYSRKGKPKFCRFRVSSDETTLIWLSHGKERNLNLSSVSRIILGQRTAVFRRYLRPEKEYLSFSLIYNNGERSLDLICKDNTEADLWLTGLKALTSTDQTDNRHTQSDINNVDIVVGTTIEVTSSITARDKVFIDSISTESSSGYPTPDVRSERSNMQGRQSIGDGFRLSVSSNPSISSQGSDDIESLGDLYVWGEIWCDNTDGSLSSFPSRNEVLTPRPLESNVVLDVHQIACGARHVGLVTKQGEVFTWGEESGGRLGHGIQKDFSRPRLVEYLAVTNVEFVACGEHHTCAISASGDLYTWGDGSHNVGLLGHGADVSHWVPKMVSGPLEGIQIMAIACGTWHSALITLNGKLLTFGDGTFGVLGHGDRETVSFPKEVDLLSGYKTVKVACGVWHTAAIVEVMGQNGPNSLSKKVFTWGDGDKYRLGHGDKESHLHPTFVSSLMDYNFHQLACGHSMTVGLTTSGHVFTVGSTEFGQLGNPTSNGKIPCLVQDKLVGEFIDDISCGAHHVAVMTSRGEVFTWGRGAHGRLGHDDTEDRKVPTLVEALKDRHVKNITCGSNYTASICIHKWVSGADQSVCSGCRQPFGFTRKRHNCYNCGLVHCHGCSSKKAMKAAMAPTPGKPHRVCDSCYNKLKTAEAGNATNVTRRAVAPRSIDFRERSDRVEPRRSRMLLAPNIDTMKYPAKPWNSSQRGSSQHNVYRAPIVAPPQSSANSRPSSPYTRRPSPPRSATPTFSRGVIDSLKKTNEFLNKEVVKLQDQARGFKHKSDSQDEEIKKFQKTISEATLAAGERSFKCSIAKEVITTISAQLKGMTESLPEEVLNSESFKSLCSRIEGFLSSEEHERQTMGSSSYEDNGDHHLSQTNEDNNKSSISSQTGHENESSRYAGVAIHGVKELNEQFEPGVYVTLIQLQNGSKLFKRVKFSKRRFSEQQAEEWWKENKDRLLKKYNPPLTSSDETESSDGHTTT
ncbi:PH, RCC1 and FYVE domains-containing protein 1-like [Impatiens glandulifera]|uniref:PH, RCC1 and FYVE domains-containing protein 1-like n=1 Tax=Impatiens glandulifera TaxID=253017 RepID=UPI001FB0DD79|nr:PH, RCC1 and FYVE domains-containing protein 1-like [Impatiens glandulifera]